MHVLYLILIAFDVKWQKKYGKDKSQATFYNNFLGVGTED